MFSLATPRRRGRLPLSWPRSVGPGAAVLQRAQHRTSSDDPEHPEREARKKFISRYIDEENSPQFPFRIRTDVHHFQLRSDRRPVQNKFSLRNAGKCALRTRANSPAVVTVSAEVKNTGARVGETLAQLYIRLDGTSIAMPVRMLKGFQSVTLAPGESRKVTFDLDAETFAFWGADNTFGVEPARVTVWIAPNSAEGQSTKFEIAEAN